VDVRGGGTGTQELEALAPLANSEGPTAVLFTGGSAFQHFIHTATGKHAIGVVFIVFPHIEIHRTPGFICHTGFNQCFDHLDLLRYMA
jgi:L-aminopeptidase/D-esterase-like protein